MIPALGTVLGTVSVGLAAVGSIMIGWAAVGWATLGWTALGWTAVAPASAGEIATCANEPLTAWVTEADLRARIAALGLSIDVVKLGKGGCYEAHGHDGALRVELSIDPITGDIVRRSPSHQR